MPTFGRIRPTAEFSRVLAVWTAELEDDGEQLKERLSGLAEQLTTGIKEMHEGTAEASHKGENPRCAGYRRPMKRCWTRCERQRGQGRHPLGPTREATAADPNRSPARSAGIYAPARDEN